MAFTPYNYTQPYRVPTTTPPTGATLPGYAPPPTGGVPGYPEAQTVGTGASTAPVGKYPVQMGNQTVYYDTQAEADAIRRAQEQGAYAPVAAGNLPLSKTGLTAPPDDDTSGGGLYVNGRMNDAEFERRLREGLKAANPNAPQSYLDEQFDYFMRKRNSGDTSSWATGEPGRTMDDYWLMRANQAASDAPGQPGYGQSSGSSATSSAVSQALATPVSAPAQVSAPRASDPGTLLMRAKILELLNTPQTVDAQSLIASPEAAANRLAVDRAADRARAQLAEQAAFEGTSNSGAQQTDLNGLRQQQGEAEAQFIGQLATTKMQQNRDALVQGIQFAMADGQFQQAQKLQAELANLDAAMQAQQLGVQRELGLLGIGFDYDQLAAQMNRDATIAMLNGV